LRPLVPLLQLNAVQPARLLLLVRPAHAVQRVAVLLLRAQLDAVQLLHVQPVAALLLLVRAQPVQRVAAPLVAAPLVVALLAAALRLNEPRTCCLTGACLSVVGRALLLAPPGHTLSQANEINKLAWRLESAAPAFQLYRPLQ